MLENTLRVRAEKSALFGDNIRIFVFEHLPGGHGTAVAQSLMMKTYEASQVIPEPDFLNISPTSAQELMDSLWQCGIRPSEGSGSAGSLLATQNHLKDLQGVVNRLFGLVEGKG